ncbi:unnamed protein product [Acanthoscelides obtectus]|uniref:Uncharacterized protein n=1 Tax=Acanthoscelides obtectus TaxID=200917 RepID=A0A9P0MF96_ACAOB|nr:unnamed protein product [Acanthoscelides obtectus]CAK1641304.1 hypothetical protein AOBTE_LOCUS12316 [Acanthoscelides obtectus]
MRKKVNKGQHSSMAKELEGTHVEDPIDKIQDCLAKSFDNLNFNLSLALDWAEIKGFCSYPNFKDQFIKRCWSSDKESEMFSHIRYGVYEGGSRADYFLKIIRESQYSSKPLINLGYQSVEDIEDYLRRIDKLDMEMAEPRNRSRNLVRENRGENPARGQWNRDGGRHENSSWRNRNEERSRNVRNTENEDRPEVSTIFNRDIDEILTEIEPVVKQENPTERVNREIGRLIRTLCHQKHTKWAYILGDIQAWLNRVIHGGTKFSSTYLHFVVEPKDAICTKISFAPSNWAEPSRELIVELAHKNLLSKAENRQQRHDDRHKLHEFNIRDKVLSPKVQKFVCEANASIKVVCA